MFHPDNIKNFDESGEGVSIAVNKLWKTHGGVSAIARSLKTNLKVSFSIFKHEIAGYRGIT